jgi:hypothetical protein
MSTPKPKTHGFDTLSLHAGARPDPATGARATPIYQSASFVFPDSDHAAALFNMERAGHVYSRLSNPTNAVLEERIAALERGVGAIATASGQAALHLAIVTLMGAGGHIVASRALYGGSHNLLDYTLPRFGITTTFVDPRDADAWRAAARRWATPGSTCSTCPASRRSRTSTACRCSSTRRSPRRGSCGRSITAPTSSSIRRPSSCPATASSSAACSSTAARSTGRAATGCPRRADASRR